MKKGKEKGLKKEVRGLWSDIVSSPYYSFGVDCETPNAFAEGLFEIFNKVGTREVLILLGGDINTLTCYHLHCTSTIYYSNLRSIGYIHSNR